MDRNTLWDRTRKAAILLFAFAVIAAAIDSSSAMQVSSQHPQKIV